MADGSTLYGDTVLDALKSKSALATDANGTIVDGEGLDPSYLKLDQTTEQIVENGAPLFMHGVHAGEDNVTGYAEVGHGSYGAYIKDPTNYVYIGDGYYAINASGQVIVRNGCVTVLTAPSFTYTDGLLTRIDYTLDFYKELSYNVDGTLATVTIYDRSSTHTKTFNYTDGVLTSISVS